MASMHRVGETTTSLKIFSLISRGRSRSPGIVYGMGEYDVWGMSALYVARYVAISTWRYSREYLNHKRKGAINALNYVSSTLGDSPKLDNYLGKYLGT